MFRILVLTVLVLVASCKNSNIKSGDFVRFEKSSSCFTKVVAIKDGDMAEVEIKGQTQTISLKDYVSCSPTQSESMSASFTSPTTDSLNKK